MCYNKYVQKYIWQGMKSSLSESRFFDSLDESVENLLSVWVSTWGFWEAIFALAYPKIDITATTIDKKGLKFTAQLFEKLWVTNRIDLRLENIVQKKSCLDKSCDRIYSRLALHYLTSDELDIALSYIYQMLNDQGKVTIIVKSNKNIVLESPEADPIYINETGQTEVTYFSEQKKMLVTKRRYYHTRETLSNHCVKAWFQIDSMREYKEKICPNDYARTKLADHESYLLEANISKN